MKTVSLVGSTGSIGTQAADVIRAQRGDYRVVALGAAVSFLLYLGLLAIPLRRLFSVTTWLIALVAAGMAGQAAAILAGEPSWALSATSPLRGLTSWTK